MLFGVVPLEVEASVVNSLFMVVILSGTVVSAIGIVEEAYASVIPVTNSSISSSIQPDKKFVTYFKMHTTLY